MRILVVEDEHRIAQSIKKGLELERYVVDVAYTGTEGYDMASAESYDVVILDRMLPEMDGITICKSLRQENNHVLILLLTAKSQTSDKVDGLNAGADDYLTKPFSFEELLARIRALSRRPSKTLQSVLKVADLELIAETFEVRRDHKPIQLSSKEYALLEYMMRHPNTTLTKQQLIDRVWNYESDILPNTIEVYIKNLRGKIDAPFKNKPPLIQTVRGFGYKIGDNV